MSAAAQLLFLPNGKCLCVYTELLSLPEIGRLTVTRRLKVEYDNEKQAWRVKDRRGFALFTAPTRQQCLDWEEKYMNERMESERYERTDQLDQSPAVHSGPCGQEQSAQVHAGVSIGL
jgi:hypothetical protein